MITGGTSGIGAAIAMAFAEEGASVLVTGATAEEVAHARAEMPSITAAILDVRDNAAVQAVIATLGTLGSSGELRRRHQARHRA